MPKPPPPIDRVLVGFDESHLHTNVHAKVHLPGIEEILRDFLAWLKTLPTAGGNFIFNALGSVSRAHGGAMLEVTCTSVEKFRVQVVPVTASGKPSKIQSGSLVVTPVADGSTGVSPVATIESDDTFSVQADIADGSASAVQLFTVEGDADLGAGVVTISDTVTLNVASEQAVNLGLAALGAVPR